MLMPIFLFIDDVCLQFWRIVDMLILRDETTIYPHGLPTHSTNIRTLKVSAVRIIIFPRRKYWLHWYVFAVRDAFKRALWTWFKRRARLKPKPVECKRESVLCARWTKLKFVRLTPARGIIPARSAFWPRVYISQTYV
jgi:hypothetical protein